MYLSFKNNNDFVLFMARYIDLGILVNIQQVIPINERQPAGFTIRANMGDIMLVRRYVYEHMKKDTRITMYHGNENYQVILENHRCSNYMDTFPVVDGIFAYIEKEDPLLFKRITPMRLMINLQLNVCYVSHYVRCVNNVPSIEECLNYGPVKRPNKTNEVEIPVDKNPSKEKIACEWIESLIERDILCDMSTKDIHFEYITKNTGGLTVRVFDNIIRNKGYKKIKKDKMSYWTKTK
jgi:hypothetical protein